MKEEKKQLFSRIGKLETWQKDMIIHTFLFFADEKKVQELIEEVNDYEQINKELDEKYGQKNNSRGNVSNKTSNYSLL